MENAEVQQKNQLWTSMSDLKLLIKWLKSEEQNFS